MWLLAINDLHILHLYSWTGHHHFCEAVSSWNTKTVQILKKKTKPFNRALYHANITFPSIFPYVLAMDNLQLQNVQYETRSWLSIIYDSMSYSFNPRRSVGIIAALQCGKKKRLRKFTKLLSISKDYRWFFLQQFLIGDGGNLVIEMLDCFLCCFNIKDGHCHFDQHQHRRFAFANPNSTNQSFWPILFNIYEYRTVRPKAIGIFCMCRLWFVKNNHYLLK